MAHAVSSSIRKSPVTSGGLRLLESFGAKSPILDLSQTRYRRVGGKPKRRRQINLTRAKPYLPSCDVGVDDQLAIDPAPDPVFRHRQPKCVPASLHEVPDGGG